MHYYKVFEEKCMIRKVHGEIDFFHRIKVLEVQNKQVNFEDCQLK